MLGYYVKPMVQVPRSNSLIVRIAMNSCLQCLTCLLSAWKDPGIYKNNYRVFHSTARSFGDLRRAPMDLAGIRHIPSSAQLLPNLKLANQSAMQCLQELQELLQEIDLTPTPTQSKEFLHNLFYGFLRQKGFQRVVCQRLVPSERAIFAGKLRPAAMLGACDSARFFLHP